MNVLLKRTDARTNTFKFSIFSRIVDMWNTLPLPFRQATTSASLKKGVREFLDGNVWGFIIIRILILFIVFFVHISVCIFTFLIVCLLNLVFIIWIFFKRWSVYYGVFDSFTDRSYGNAFVFITYVKPFTIKL